MSCETVSCQPSYGRVFAWVSFAFCLVTGLIYAFLHDCPAPCALCEAPSSALVTWTTKDGSGNASSKSYCMDFKNTNLAGCEPASGYACVPLSTVSGAEVPGVTPIASESAKCRVSPPAYLARCAASVTATTAAVAVAFDRFVFCATNATEVSVPGCPAANAAAPLVSCYKLSTAGALPAGPYPQCS